MVTQSNQSQTSDETHEDPPEDSLTEANSGRKQHRQRQSEMEKGIAQRERKRERESSKPCAFWTSWNSNIFCNPPQAFQISF